MFSNKKSKSSDDSHSNAKLKKEKDFCPLHTQQSHKAHCGHDLLNVFGNRTMFKLHWTKI